MDALIAVGFVAALLAAFAPVRHPERVARIFTWRHFWITIALVLAGFEVGSLVEVGMTLSQQYSGWSLAVGTVRAAVPAALVAVLGVGLAIHLLWKRIKRKEPKA